MRVALCGGKFTMVVAEPVRTTQWVNLPPGHVRAPRILGDRKLQLGHAQISRPPAAPHLWQLDYRQFAFEDCAC